MAGNGGRQHGGVTITVAEGATVTTGHIAGGDQTIKTQAVDVEALGAHLAELTASMRELCGAVMTAPDIDEDRRDELVHTLSGASKELGAAGEAVRELPAGEAVPASLSTRIKDQLEPLADAAKSASTLVTGVQALAHKLSPLISTIGNMLG